MITADHGCDPGFPGDGPYQGVCAPALCWKAPEEGGKSGGTEELCRYRRHNRGDLPLGLHRGRGELLGADQDRRIVSGFIYIKNKKDRGAGLLSVCR